MIGDPAIAIELEPGLELTVDADLFSQVNHAQNRRLIGFVMEIAARGRASARSVLRRRQLQPARGAPRRAR